jgi:hypothetical protein
MPFIYPKRFLRPRDVLDPSEFNSDTKPVQELLDGELDRHNFNATSLKNGLKKHPDDVAIRGDTNASLAEAAYFSSSYVSVEVPVVFKHTKDLDDAVVDATPSYLKSRNRKTPNFVTPDGGTFRDFDMFDGESSIYPNYDGTMPSIIPNSGSWDSVKNADLTDGMRLTVTTGQANLYINAFVQYVWQGFYEYKPPWKFDGINTDTSNYGWEAVYGNELATAEAESLNNNGPTSTWLTWGNQQSGNAFLTGYSATEDGSYSWTAGDSWIPEVAYINVHCTDSSKFPVVFDASYSYALNELVDTSDERAMPQQGGYHHISKGFYPANVQFALRVDGKIIDETITGREYSFEESAHGLRVEDSPDIATAKKGFFLRLGQRSPNFDMNYSGAERQAVPGQKLRSSRASACGPEVLPVRLGAVYAVEPGTHTIEIVARRISRKRKKFEYGDFVGVFSRRLHAMVLPVDSTQTDLDPNTLPVQTKNLQSENLIEVSEEFNKYEALKNRLNSLHSQDLKKRSLPNTHLPSKVRYWNSVGWNPTFNVVSGHLCRTENATQGDSQFPGWYNWRDIDRRSYGNWYSDYDSSVGDLEFGAGWKLLETTDGNGSLRIADADDLKLAANEELLIFAEVEVRNLIPYGLPSFLRSHIEAAAAGGDSDGITYSTILAYLVQHRYLDLFGLLAIGYRTGSDDNANWTIASKEAPAVINASNWVNRARPFIPVDDIAVGKPLIHSESDFVSTETSISFAPKKVDLRGMNTQPSNLGITVPLFLRLTRDDFASDAAAELTEVAIFGCTTFPSDWDTREAEATDVDSSLFSAYPRTAREDFTPKGEAGPLPDYSSAANMERAWQSPAYGRKIIDGVNFNFGRGRLTVMKLVK